MNVTLLFLDLEKAEARRAPLRIRQGFRTTHRQISSWPRGAALLIHGLTDSPYSLRRVAEILQEEGYHVVGLRLPGHGTNPGTLATVSW